LNKNPGLKLKIKTLEDKILSQSEEISNLKSKIISLEDKIVFRKNNFLENVKNLIEGNYQFNQLYI